ncbi:phospho-sugar mutase [Miniphocaeibacter massiliensis]|uniref:phospho-sugar mutase n=1 Tax=Miniphocaeibacter massiliensis TaxID=2041841 RepID=UPI000C1BAC67|nr:phospho-sugar mutase [Miniphocaeibacter massiliensis]
MGYREVYEEWLKNDFFDNPTKEEILSIKNNDEEIRDRFYKSLEFGTAGLRGKIGVGTNRMNKYIVAKTTQGLAYTILSRGKEAREKGVVISYDVRYFSKEFAEVAASVLAGNGIKVYLSDRIRPTPVLSYAIRYFKAISGIMITASHNPKEYNGYKAYWKEGSQILDNIAEEIIGNIDKVEKFSSIKTMNLEEAFEIGVVEYFGEKLDDAYIKDILTLSIEDEKVDKNISVVYSPLNGTGNKFVSRILKERDFNNVYVVKEQELPDSDFETVGYPNPEDPKAFKYAIDLGRKVKADILIATDPDADRIAVEVRDVKGEYVFLNGNKIGALLINYILSTRSTKNNLPKNGVIVKSIVTGDLGSKIAEKYDIEMVETLTGFKNIEAKANEYDITGDKTFIFGFEESIGFNYGTFVRDKDAVSTAMIIVEMVGYYKNQNKSLLDILEELYNEYGYYDEQLNSIVLEGLEGQCRIKMIMEEFRESPIEKIGYKKLVKVEDFLKDIKNMGKSNVLKFYYDDGSWYALRPSGTEPKIKTYIYTIGFTKKEVRDNIEITASAIKAKFDNIK